MLRPRPEHLVLFLLVLAVFYPVMTMDFAYTDDFQMIVDAQVTHNAVETQCRDGRFLYGGWINGMLGNVHGLAGFKYVRMVTVLGIYLTTLLFHTLVERRLVRDRVWATALAALFAVNPGFLALSGWAGLGSHCWAMGLGLLSIVILLGCPPGQPSADDAARPPSLDGIEPLPSWGRISMAGVCLFLGLGLYQSTAMAFWLGILIWVATQFDGQRVAWRRLAGFFVFFWVVTCAYFLLAHLLNPGGGPHRHRDRADSSAALVHPSSSKRRLSLSFPP